MSGIKSIPDVPFLQKRKHQIEFDILTFEQLFSAREKYDHDIDRPHRTQFFCIFFVVEGEGTHYIDLHAHRYESGSIIFISAGQVHAFEINLETNGYLLLFTESFVLKNLTHSDSFLLDQLYNYHLRSPVLHAEKTAILAPIINEIYDEYHMDDPFAKGEILRILLKLLLIKAERIKQTMLPQDQNAQWLITFFAFRTRLQNQFTETRNAKVYAEMLGVSYKYLNDICKAICGETAKVFIDNFVVLEMKRHLATSNCSIKELTYKLGFDEPTNFVKFFKRHTNISPTQFRRSLST